MGALSAAVVCLSCARWHATMDEAAIRFGIPVSWIERVMAVESRGHSTLNGKPITSPAGAMGLMQIMPDTWNYLRGRYGFGPDPYDSRDNIFAGAAYLHELYERYSYPNLFAAYNAGRGRLDAYLLRGTALPTETTAYVRKVAGSDVGDVTLANTPNVPVPTNALFFVNREASTGEVASQAASESGGSLFVAPTSPTP